MFSSYAHKDYLQVTPKFPVCMQKINSDKRNFTTVLPTCTDCTNSTRACLATLTKAGYSQAVT